MEPEYWDKNPYKATAKSFPSGFHYRPTYLNKTIKFYEFILVDTKSVSIKHFKDPKDQSLNTHSTIQLLKVMQPRHYRSNLNQPKKFFAPFDPAGYTYWDYINVQMRKDRFQKPQKVESIVKEEGEMSDNEEVYEQFKEVKWMEWCQDVMVEEMKTLKRLHRLQQTSANLPKEKVCLLAYFLVVRLFFF